MLAFLCGGKPEQHLMRERRIHHWAGVVVGLIVAVIGQVSMTSGEAPRESEVVASPTNSLRAGVLPARFDGLRMR